MVKKVLILEDDDTRIELFKKRFEEEDELHIVKHAQEAIDLLKENSYDLICLDHDLGDQQMEWDEEDCGLVVADYIHEHPVECPVIVHSFNTARAMRMVYQMSTASYKPGFWLGKAPIFE